MPPRPRAQATMLAAALLVGALPWAPAQGQADDESVGLADELRLLREEAREANRLSWMLFLASFVVGMAIAAVAVAGTVRNAWQLRRHVDLVQRDMDERLRPELGRTTDSNLLPRPIDIDSGGLFRVRIINAGQVAARKIVCDMKFGMASDFEAGVEEHKRENRGFLAPDKLIEVRVPITTEQMRAASQQDQFHVEILVEYSGPGGKEYGCPVNGDYDGVEARWSD